MPGTNYFVLSRGVDVVTPQKPNSQNNGRKTANRHVIARYAVAISKSRQEG